MEIVYKRVDDLIEYEGNARRNDAGVAKVAESIREFGFLNPITIDPNNVIIAGHTRLKAAKQLGMEEVPCIVQNLSEEDAKLARIIDNKSHEYSTWDVGKLHQELNGIGLDFKTTFFTSCQKMPPMTSRRLSPQTLRGLCGIWCRRRTRTCKTGRRA